MMASRGRGGPDMMASRGKKKKKKKKGGPEVINQFGHFQELSQDSHDAYPNIPKSYLKPSPAAQKNLKPASVTYSCSANQVKGSVSSNLFGSSTYNSYKNIYSSKHGAPETSSNQKLN